MFPLGCGDDASGNEMFVVAPGATAITASLQLYNSHYRWLFIHGERGE